MRRPDGSRRGHPSAVSLSVRIAVMAVLCGAACFATATAAAAGGGSGSGVLVITQAASTDRMTSTPVRAPADAAVARRSAAGPRSTDSRASPPSPAAD